MKAIPWKHGLGALLLCVGVGACTQDTSDRETAQAPATVPEATAPQAPAAGTAQTDPYATMPPPVETDSMTGSTDISATQTTGDTLGDRCAGFTGDALTECLQAEALRRQDVQDPTQTPPQDVPQQ